MIGAVTMWKSCAHKWRSGRLASCSSRWVVLSAVLAFSASAVAQNPEKRGDGKRASLAISDAELDDFEARLGRSDQSTFVFVIMKIIAEQGRDHAEALLRAAQVRRPSVAWCIYWQMIFAQDRAEARNLAGEARKEHFRNALAYLQESYDATTYALEKAQGEQGTQDIRISEYPAGALRAYASLEFARKHMPDLPPTKRGGYAWLAGNLESIGDYELPEYETWSRLVRKGTEDLMRDVWSPTVKQNAPPYMRRFRVEMLREMIPHLHVDLALAALEAGELAAAKRHVSELLKNNTNPKSGNDAHVSHRANEILGRVALREGNLAEAKRFLLKAGQTPGSAVLNSYGPSMYLAEELSVQGEREVVLAYFSLCSKFWKSDRNTRIGGGRLNEWSRTILEDRIPDFGRKSRGASATAQRQLGTEWDAERGEPDKKGGLVLRYPNGKKLGEGTFENGKPHGKFTTWYENGQKWLEWECQEGKRHGKWTDWHDNGQKWAEGQYLDGKRHGDTTYWNEDRQITRVPAPIVDRHASAKVNAPLRKTSGSNIIYVDKKATGADDGTSWNNAFNDLQDALEIASLGQEIWVAKGTYLPDRRTGDRNTLFELRDGVALYGGFAGGETKLNQRNITLNETILSGDLLGNGGILNGGALNIKAFRKRRVNFRGILAVRYPSAMIDNTYHVVTGDGTDASAVLDGFTITGGSARRETVQLDSRSGSMRFGPGGGGMHNKQGSPTVRNCTFRGNFAASGGGMANVRNSNPTVINCTFTNNVVGALGGIVGGRPYTGGMSGMGGAGMYNAGSNPTLIGCTFSENMNGSNSGGGMFNNNSSPIITNCTFVENVAWAHGGGLANQWKSNPTLTNCTFIGNEARMGGGIRNIGNRGNNPTVKNCTFAGNSAREKGGGMYNEQGGSPKVTNCIFSGNSDRNGTNASAQIHVGKGKGQVTPKSVSGIATGPVVSYSLIQGGWSGKGNNNIDADPLFVDADGPDDIPGTADDNLRLQFGSPCIDAGDNSTITTTTDLDGNPRITNSTVDMGAHEFKPGARKVGKKISARP